MANATTTKAEVEEMESVLGSVKTIMTALYKHYVSKEAACGGNIMAFFCR